MPATGSVAALITKATGRDPYFVGKPNPMMFRSALNRIEAHSESTVMIGDRMDTDVVAGIEAGLDTVLVLTGSTTVADIEKYPFRPGRVWTPSPTASNSFDPCRTRARSDGFVARDEGPRHARCLRVSLKGRGSPGSEGRLDPGRSQERDLRRAHALYDLCSGCDRRRRPRGVVDRLRRQCPGHRGVSAVADIEMIGVPFDGYGRVGHQARAAGALRDAGLRDAFDHHHVIDDDDIALPYPDPDRGPSTSLINEPALLAMTEALNRKVGTVVGAGRFPFVYGGDCSMLLGIVTGLRDHVGDVGLVFIDGHEDTMPLDVSEDGEAANTEIGLLLGLTGRLLTGELGDRLPALRPEQLVILGPRDDAWRQQFNVGTLADSGVWMAPLAEVADNPAGTARQAIEQLSSHVSRWWLHIDLDVLDPRVPCPGAARRRRRTRRPDVGSAHRPRHGAVHRTGVVCRRQPRDLRPGPGSRRRRCRPDREFVRNVLVRPTISP